MKNICSTKFSTKHFPLNKLSPSPESVSALNFCEVFKFRFVQISMHASKNVIHSRKQLKRILGATSWWTKSACATNRRRNSWMFVLWCRWNRGKADENRRQFQLLDPFRSVNSNSVAFSVESFFCVSFTVHVCCSVESGGGWEPSLACTMKKLKSKNDPLPITSKFCCYFELKPSVTIYIFGEFLVWTVLLFTSLNLEFDCLDTTDLSEFHAVLDKNWYYNLIFGQPDPIPHDNARCKWNQSV